MRATATRPTTAIDERCACGHLVARLTPRGVEILCRRCKRVHRIAWDRESRRTER